MVSVMLIKSQAVTTIVQGKKPHSRHKPMHSSVVPAHSTKSASDIGRPIQAVKLRGYFAKNAWESLGLR